MKGARLSLLPEAIGTILAGSSIFARLAETLIHVDFTPVAQKSRWALAQEAPKLIDPGKREYCSSNLKAEFLLPWGTLLLFGPQSFLLRPAVDRVKHAHITRG